jgi:hypothetical protein
MQTITIELDIYLTDKPTKYKRLIHSSLCTCVCVIVKYKNVAIKYISTKIDV